MSDNSGGDIIGYYLLYVPNAYSVYVALNKNITGLIVGSTSINKYTSLSTAA